jgi:hypothetical protein
MLKIWEKYGRLILAAILIVIILFYIDGCNKNRAKDNRIASLLEYEHTVKQYSGKDGTIVNYNKSLEVRMSDLQAINDSLIGYLKNLELKIKNVHSTTIITERLRIDTLEVPVYLTDCKFDTTIVIDSTHYDMDLRLTNRGITFNSLSFPNRSVVTLADKKEKWWKRPTPIVTVTNTNPYMQTEGISSFEFKQNQKWYQKWWIHAIEGAILGGIATYYIVK